jgi:hypothetical protein
VHEDTVRDLQALAQQLAANSSMWSSLAPQEKQLLGDTYKRLGLDLEELVQQLRVQARQQYIDARMADLMIKWEVRRAEVVCGQLKLGTRGDGGKGGGSRAGWGESGRHQDGSKAWEGKPSL